MHPHRHFYRLAIIIYRHVLLRGAGGRNLFTEANDPCFRRRWGSFPLR